MLRTDVMHVSRAVRVKTRTSGTSQVALEHGAGLFCNSDRHAPGALGTALETTREAKALSSIVASNPHPECRDRLLRDPVSALPQRAAKPDAQCGRIQAGAWSVAPYPSRGSMRPAFCPPPDEQQHLFQHRLPRADRRRSRPLANAATTLRLGRSRIFRLAVLPTASSERILPTGSQYRARGTLHSTAWTAA